MCVLCMGQNMQPVPAAQHCASECLVSKHREKKAEGETIVNYLVVVAAGEIDSTYIYKKDFSISTLFVMSERRG